MGAACCRVLAGGRVQRAGGGRAGGDRVCLLH